MSTTHQITCTTQTSSDHSKGHILSVGVGASARRLTVADVYSMMNRGEIFYTSDSMGNVALVRKYKCSCGRDTLRSAPDATTANNLDYLGLCPWAA